MNVYYEPRCGGCKRKLKLPNPDYPLAHSPEYAVWWALKNGWAILHSEMYCPECMTDNYNEDALFGKPNENKEETDATIKVL